MSSLNIQCLLPTLFFFFLLASLQQQQSPSYMFNVKIKLPRFLLCGQEANIIEATREPHKWLFNKLASRMLNTSESVLYFFHLWCFADKHVARIAFRRLNEVCSRQTFWSLRRCGRLIVLSVSFVPSAKTAAQSGAGFSPLFFKLS